MSATGLIDVARLGFARARLFPPPPFPFPRPCPCRRPDVDLAVGKDGMVDLSPLAGEFSRPQARIAQKWLAALTRQAPGHTSCTTSSALEAAFRLGRGDGPLFRQILRQLFFHVETAALSRLRTGSPKGAALQVHAVDLEALLHQPHKLSRELLKHTVAQRAACSGVTNLAVATDKGHCGALALAPFIYAVPQGLAFVGVPQAALSANRPRNPDPGAAQKIRAVFMVYTRFGR